MFYLGGVGLAFFLTLLLFSKSKKTVADKILGCWLLFVSAHLLLFYFRKMWLYPQVLGVEIPFPLVHGPFLYLYTRALTHHRGSLLNYLLHFIPAIAALIYIIPFLMLSTEQKMWVYQNAGAGYETFGLIKSIAIILSGVVYVILSSVALHKHRLSIVNQFSYTDKINLEWLQYLIYWMGVIWLIVIFGNDDWIFVVAVFFIVFIGFFGIRQVGIFHTPEVSASAKEEINGVDETVSTATDAVPEKRKYQKSGLSLESAEALHQQLVQLMLDEKPFCESELSLTDLAARLNTQPNYLSQVINEREGKNFYDYINTLRIDEFKRLASRPDSRKYTFLALAEQCGFNSKSSFNRYFKKVEGQSPSEFMSSISDAGK